MYFRQFPKIAYSFDLSPNGVTYAATNILSRFRFNDSVLNNSYAFYKYQYTESDTPELISNKEYGDPQYYWVITMINQINDPLFEFPLRQDALERQIVKKYGYTSIANAFSEIHHYELEVNKTLAEVNGATTETVENSIITLEQFNYSTNALTPVNINVPVTQNVVFYSNNSNSNTSVVATLTITSTYRPIYVYDYELEENEKKREIKLLKRQYIQPLMLEVESILND